jgi:predicted SprT family Zn-dependent metalloprotease
MDLRDAFRMGTNLLEQHGLDDWAIQFDNAKRRAGVCRPARKLIGLSGPLTRLHSESEVRDTILHEIAHALVGQQHYHDAVWLAKAREIGCSGERCVPADAPRVAAPWLGVCAAGHTTERHKRPERVQSCGQCHSGFSPQHLYEWTYHGRPAQMHPNYEAELRDIRQGTRRVAVRVGEQARVTAPGAFHGRVGTVLKRGRTSYHLQLPEGVLRVVFAAVEPVEAG